MRIEILVVLLGLAGCAIEGLPNGQTDAGVVDAAHCTEDLIVPFDLSDPSRVPPDLADWVSRCDMSNR